MTTDGPRDGESFDSQRDETRLNKQARRVFSIMSDHGWHTLAELEDRTGDTSASISARIRDLRKPRFGAYTVERRYVAQGVWEYRMLDTYQSLKQALLSS